MRVTNKMLSNNFLSDMQNNLENLKIIQQQMTSGKEIRKPSDDPLKAARIIQINTDINANKQYNENIKNTISWLDTTDTALNQVGKVVQRVRELMVYAGNSAQGPNERKAIKDEINQKVGELSQIMNTNFDGKYIFGGTRGTTKPVGNGIANNNTTLIYNPGDTTDATVLAQIGSKLKVEVSQGVIMDYNVTATDIIEYGEGKDLRNLLKTIVNHLDGNNSDGTAVDASAVKSLTNEDLTDITNFMNNVLRIRSEVGAKQNRMDSAKDKNEDENFNMTEILSKTEDVDKTEKTMEYATMLTVYMSALQTSAKVLQPSLMDYLR